MMMDREYTENSHITVCICTYKRPYLLENLISRLEEQQINENVRFNVVIVDNDPEVSAKAVVRQLIEKTTIDLQYFHEPERGISSARNKSIREADGQYIVFMDDDEFPDNQWLQQLYDSITKYGADGVLGPVEPYYDEQTPDWLRKSDLLQRSRFQTGYVIKDSKFTRTGNVIFDSSIFAGMSAPFDPKYGKIGGGDVDFFQRMLEVGKTFVWCDEAIVYEIIEDNRKSKMYYIKRAFTRGLKNSMSTPFLSIGTCKSIIAIPVYMLIAPCSSLFGQHVFMKYAVKLCDHLGKILGYFNVKVVKERPY